MTIKHAESNPLCTAGRLWRSAAGMAGLFAVLGQAQADTIVGGSINVDTWTKAKSPYRVNSNIQVNGPLTIEPGVRVIFQGGYTFEVQGKLWAVGTTSEPIVFTQTNGASWQGIYFNNSLAGSQLINCLISNTANCGLLLVNPGAAPQISGCTLANHSNVGLSAAVSTGGLALTNCTFIRNSGRGLYASLATGNLFLTNCTFINNTTTSSGGGIWAELQAGNLILTNCTFTNNTAPSDGGAVYALVHGKQMRLGHCVFQANSATPDSNTKSSHGGAICVAGDSVLSDCLILNNFCKSYSYVRTSPGDALGGGVYSTAGDMVLTRCTFTGNRADYVSYTYYSYSHGGGLALVGGSLTASNCVFLANTATAPNGNNGGGIYIDSSPLQLVNCSCAYNWPEGVCCTSGTIFNSILFWNNKSGTDNLAQYLGNLTISYSDVQKGATVNGNINGPLLFQSSIDLHLSPSSPCIDAGNPAQVFNDCCFPPSMGSLRNDMGAYGGPEADVAHMPVIVSQSGWVPSCPQQNVTLFVNATGSLPLSYQWWFQNTLLPNETNSTLALPNVSAVNSGIYSVVVTNDWGSATSSPIPLAVNDFCVDIHMSANGANLTVSGVSGTTAVLSYTTELVNPNWIPLATNTLGTVPWVYVDAASTSSPHRYYKATLAR